MSPPMTYSPVSSEMSWWSNSRSQWQQPLKNDGFLSANAFGITLINGELSVKSAFKFFQCVKTLNECVTLWQKQSVFCSVLYTLIWRVWELSALQSTVNYMLLSLSVDPLLCTVLGSVSLQLAECWLNSTLLKCFLLPLPCAAVTRLCLWTVSFQTLVIPSENSRYDLNSLVPYAITSATL